MKGSQRTLLLVLVLVLVLGLGSYFLFFKKKKKPAKPTPKPPLAELLPSPTPEAKPPATPMATPVPGMMPPGPPPGFPPAMPGATPPPGLPGSPPGVLPPGLPPGMMPPGTPAPLIPRAESLPSETQATLDLKLGNPIKTAEGTTLVLEQAELLYAGKARVKFLWEVVKGPTDLIKIIDPQALKTRVVVDNLEAATEFTLRLTANDGKTEAAAELMITGFPAQFSKVGRTGGAWSGVSHMGSNWVAVRGSEVEIFNPKFESLARLIAPFMVRNFFAVQGKEGKGAVFIQAPEGQWAVLQSDPVSDSKLSQLPMLGKGIRRVSPFTLENEPYVFALLERGVELWNLSDPTHPKLKSSIGQAFLKGPMYLGFLGRNLYVADEEMIHLIDYPAGNLVASVPAGGSITSLDAFNWDDKNYLLAGIGADRGPQGRKDYGLRLFEIAADGRLSGEKRLALKGNPPVRQAYVVPGVGKALVGVSGEGGLELRMVAIKPLEEISLEGAAGINFLAFSEIETGKINEEPVAVIADGNQLRILAFKPAGERAMAVSQKQNVPGLISAGWVDAKPDGSQVWVGDEGTMAGGALVVLQGADLKILKAQNSPGSSYPASGDVRSGAEEGVLLLIAEDLQKLLKTQQKEGALGLFNTKDAMAWTVENSAPVFGTVSPQGVLRPLAVAARAMEGTLRVGVAIARVTGNVGGAGLLFWTKPVTESTKAFVQGDPAKTGQLIPLSDARDLVFSKDGKAAFVAAGVDGVIALDVEKKQALARMSLGSKDWWADRVVLSNAGNMLLAAFLQPASGQVIVKIFAVAPDLKMQEFGTIAGLRAVGTAEGMRAPVPGLTEDDLYLFLPSPGRLRSLRVLNLSNPAQPFPIAELQTEGEVRGVSVANRFRDIFVAMGPAGVAKFSFGF